MTQLRMHADSSVVNKGKMEDGARSSRYDRLMMLQTSKIRLVLLLFGLQSCEERKYIESDKSQIVMTAWALLGLMAVQ